MDTASLLSGDERCGRIAHWGLDWEREKIEARDLLAAGIKAGLTSTRKDFNQEAGEAVIGVARDREVIQDDKCDQFSSIIHLASLADVVSSAIRRPSDEPWRLSEPVPLDDGILWTPSCYLSPRGDFLRRVVLVSAWNQDRHYAELRSWHSLGEVCIQNLPMQLIIIILGQRREGRYNGYWSRGYLHPVNKKLRFRRKNFIGQGFKDSWKEAWREDHDELPTSAWLDGMMEDGVLEDVRIRIDLPVPSEENRQRIVNLAKSKLRRIYSTKEIPEQNLSICDWPTPCIFRLPCHAQEPVSGRFGFMRIDEINK